MIPIRTSVLTCPFCGFRSEERMPADACRYFHECSACGERLRPDAGDCCVFCSFGSVPCPPVQMRRVSAGRRDSCEPRAR